MLKSKPIVSFTLFGFNLKYYVGAVENARSIQTLMPEWEMRVYYRSDYILPEYINILAELNVKLINLVDVSLGSVDTAHCPFFWRFLSFLEDTPSIVRDLDSRISYREIQYINNWLNSKKDYFIIRDHPWHSPVPSGLFGIRRKIKAFEDHFVSFINSNELVWGTDQTVLQFYMNDISKEDIYYCGYDYRDNYIPRDDKNFFIGMQIDEHNNPLEPSAIQALNYLKDLNI